MPMHTDQRPIVVGYDASNTADAALDWAGHLAASAGASVNVLYAAQLVVYAQNISYGQWRSPEEREFTEEVAREGAQRLQAKHPQLEVSTTGSLHSATVALDKASANASLIVVGSHGRGRIGSVMLGSTAYALSGHARCPVVVVRDAQAPLPGRTHPIVVGCDGSESSDRALDAAADLAAQWGAPLLVITAWAPPPPDPWDRPPLGFTSVEDFMMDRIAHAELTNEAGKDRAQRRHTAPGAELDVPGEGACGPDVSGLDASGPDVSGPDVSGFVVEARPEDAVMEATSQAAMLVLGSRGHGALAGALLGSTARSVLHQTYKPVMIVH